jgi:phosphatidylserine/phosphatidylglycerophosphate/cardiolipin synthase-like enzyme
MDECDPKYWFIQKKELFLIKLRETGSDTYIPQSQLLEERFRDWGLQNHKNVYDTRWGDYVYNGWDLPKPEEHLLKDYTSENDVAALIHGDEFMQDLYDKLSATDAVQFVLITGWQFSMSRWLNDHDHQKSLLRNVLENAVESASKAQVRLLSFDHPFFWFENPKMVDAVNKLYPVDKPPTKAGYLEGELGGFAVSHHQKEVFVGGTSFEKSYAYVGGMDLAVDRWDTAKHEKSTKEDRFYGWHDIQVRVTGDANTQIWANFAERWDAVNKRISTVPKKMEDFRLKPCPVPAWKEHLKAGTHHVQVLRTVARAPNSNRGRFMPEGERTVLCALKKAIEKAECYIYIEEQFLWDCELADLIGARMQEKDSRLRLIVVLAAESEFTPGLRAYHYHLRSLFFQTVMGVDSKSKIAFGPKTRVYAYGLYQTPDAGGRPIYVHSKLFIIDDRYVAIGSANVDARSMHIETELTLGIVDAKTVLGTLDGKAAKVCAFARDLREKLWKEHLGIDTLPPDPIDALNQFPRGFVSGYQPGVGDLFEWPMSERAAKAKECNTHHIRCYVNIPGTANRVPPAGRRILDRNQRQWRRQRPGT